MTPGPQSLPGFPTSLPHPVAATSPLHAHGITLRPALEQDMAFLRGLYHQSRAAELAAVPWPDVTRRAFLDSQFELQHRHYIGQYPDAAFLIVERTGSPLGRLYLHADGDALHIIDILLLSAMRGQGVGTALLAHVRQLARQHACDAVQLSVLRDNAAALRLYQRLGFTRVGGDAMRLAMRQALS